MCNELNGIPISCMLLLKYALMDFRDTWTKRSSGWEDNRVFRNWGPRSSRGQLESLFKYTQNASTST